MQSRHRLAVAVVWFAIAACSEPAAPRATLVADRAQAQAGSVPGLDRLQHIVVIYLENHSFDNLYGEFPGADGRADAAGTTTQVDATGTPYATLPVNAGSPFPTTLANAPFPIEQYP